MKTKRLSFKLTAILMALTMLFVSMPLTITASDLGQSTEEVQPSTSSGTNSSDSSVSSEQLALGGESSLSELTEDITLRDKFTKHYTDVDGKRYAVVFSEQVHYLENENWVEIDNSLKYDPATKKYVSGNSGFGTAFADNANASQLVSMTDGEHSLSWSVTFAQESSSSKLTATESTMSVQSSAGILAEQSDNRVKTKENMSDMGKAVSGIRYNSVHLSSVDLRYSVLHGKVEEDIILNSSDGFTSYMLTVNTGGLTAVKNADNSISFNDASGEEIFKLGAPWMKDSLISVSDDIAVELLQKGNTAYIAYTPNAEWLNDESRVYPVLIDPSFTTRYYTNNYEDTYVYEGDSTSTTRPAEQTMKIGNISGKTYYAYIKILNIPMPESAWTNIEATFNFLVGTTTAPELNIYEVLDTWAPSSITFANQPDSELIDTDITSTPYNQAIAKYSVDLDNWINGAYDSSYDGPYFESSDWNGFKIGYATEATNSYTEIFSSEVVPVTYRPTLTISYDYTPTTGIEDGAVYSFKNVSSGKYMTVHNGEVDDGTNVYEYTGESSESQAFRLKYDSTNNCFRITAVCAEAEEDYDRALYFSYADSINSTSGYVPQNLCIYESLEEYVNDQEWIIEPYGDTNQYKIVSRADPNLAITAYGSGDHNGTASGTSYTSYGNISVAEFVGADNQLWIFESGGQQIVPSYHDIKNSNVHLQKFTVEMNKTDYPLLCCPVTEFGDTVEWTSSETQSVTVASNGRISTGTPGISQVTAKITHADGTVTEYYCYIIVKLEDGVYYFNNASNDYRIQLPDMSAWGSNVPLIAYYDGEPSEPDLRNGVFKVKYLGEGLYSIRSMIDCKMGWTAVGNVLTMRGIGTTDENIPAVARWFIRTDANGYYFQCSSGITTQTVTCPTGSSSKITLQSYHLNNPYQHWTVGEVDTLYNGVDIFDTVDYLLPDEQHTFYTGVYSSVINENGQNGVTLSVTNGTGSATLSSSGVLTPTSPGTVTLTATYRHNSYTTWTDTHTVTILELAEGTYFFRNGEYEKYMQIDDNTATNTEEAKLELFPLDGGSYQKWMLEHIGNGYYKIISLSSGKAATAPSSLNSYLIQQTYSGAYSQQWMITSTDDGMYRLSPRSNLSYYMAAGDGILTSNGRNVEMRTSQSDNKDEWEIVPFELRAYSVGGEMHDGDDVINAANTWENCGYTSSYDIDPSVNSLNNDLLDSSVVYFSSHGYQHGLSLLNNIFLSDRGESDEDKEALFDEDSIVLYIDDYYLSNARLYIYDACLTASNLDNSGENLCTNTIDEGVDCVIGWTTYISAEDALNWQSHFQYRLSHGDSVIDAANYANTFSYMYNGTIKSWRIYGDEELIIDENMKSANSVLINTDTFKLTNIAYAEHDEDVLKSILSSTFSTFSDVDASITVTYTSLDQSDYVVDYMYMHNGYISESGYSVVVEDGVITYVRDNTIANTSNADISLYTDFIVPEVTQSTINEANAQAELQMLAINDSYVVVEQFGEKFYDIESGKYYYKVLTVYKTLQNTYGTVSTLYEL